MSRGKHEQWSEIEQIETALANRQSWHATGAFLQIIMVFEMWETGDTLWSAFGKEVFHTA
ncbi:MAG: hypothetical protein ACOC7P_00845 [Chloroflexota bacterium]